MPPVRGFALARWIFATLALVVCSWVGGGYLIADRFLYLGIVDYSDDEEREVIAALPVRGLVKEPVVIESAGILLDGSWFENPAPADCAVILLPGIGGYRTQVLPALPLFYELGCHVLAYDPRGTGASARADRTFGFLEKKDNANAVRWVETRTGLPRSRVGVWGPSFGAAVGILTLEETPGLGFVIADSTFASFEWVTRDTITLLSHSVVAEIFTPLVLGFLEWRTGMVVAEVDPTAAIADAGSPVLLVHALADPAMNVAHSRAVFARRTGDHVQLEITDWGAGHADSALVDPEAYRRLVRGFLSRIEFADPR